MSEQILRYLGLGIEGKYGEAVDAQIHRDILSATLDKPGDPLIHYDGGLSRMRRLSRPGFYSPTGNVVLGADMGVLKIAFAAALGGGDVFSAVVISGADDARANDTFYRNDAGAKEQNAALTWGFINADETIIYGFHGGLTEIVVYDPAESGEYIYQSSKISDPGPTIDVTWASGDEPYPKLQWGFPSEPELWGNTGTLLPALTARIGKDIFEHVFSGCIVNSLELAVDDSYAQLTVDLAGRKDGRADLLDFCQLDLGDDVTLAFHEMRATRGFESAQIRSLNLTVNNNVDAAGGRGPGSRYPHRIPAGAREVNAELTLWYENEDHVKRFWGGETGPGNLGPTEFDLELEFTDPGSGETLTISLPRCIYSAASHQPSGRDRMDESVSVIALMEQVQTGQGVKCTEIYAKFEQAES